MIDFDNKWGLYIVSNYAAKGIEIGEAYDCSIFKIVNSGIGMILLKTSHYRKWIVLYYVIKA